MVYEFANINARTFLFFHMNLYKQFDLNKIIGNSFLGGVSKLIHNLFYKKFFNNWRSAANCWKSAKNI